MACGSRGRRDGHSSGTPVARRIKQPTRMTGPDGPEACASRHSYSVLLPVGFAVPLPLPETRCALTAPFHPYRGQYATQPWRSVLCGTVPEASPREGSTPPDVIRHRSSMEPGLSSPAAFRHWRGAAVRPTDGNSNGVAGPPRQAVAAGMVSGSRPSGAGRVSISARKREQRRGIGDAVDPRLAEMALKGGDHVAGQVVVDAVSFDAVAVGLAARAAAASPRRRGRPASPWCR